MISILMKTLTNYISRMFYNEKSPFTIVSSIDFNYLFTEKELVDYIYKIISLNPLLRNRIVNQYGTLYVNTDESINIKDHYSILESSYTEFSKDMGEFLNSPFSTELHWDIKYYIDKEAQKSRLYFKIDHAYADGYQIIKILTSPFSTDDITTKLNRKVTTVDTLFYIIVGLIILFSMTLHFIIKLCMNPFYKPVVESSTDFIQCRSFSFSKIKEFTKQHNITINDFLYSLLLKTDRLYTRTDRLVFSTSPINMSGINKTNNMCPLFLNSMNSTDTPTLLKDIHSIFNCCKYSYYIPGVAYCLGFISQYLSTDILQFLYSTIIGSSDYTYTNMIGPDLSGSNVHIEKISFLMTTTSNEICYNIISYNDSINLICTFRKNVIKDKKRFEDCIYQAYKDLLKTKV